MPRWQVRDAHRGFHLVHVLAARAARAEGVNAHFLGLHDDLDSIVDFRNDEYRGERCVAARGLIERRNPNQTMHAAFGGEKSEGVLAFDAHRRGFQSRAFAGRQIHYGRAKSFSLRPAEIHAQQHFGPILRFHAAGAGLDGHDGVQAVVLTGEQRDRFQFGNVGVGGVDFALDFAKQRIALGNIGFFLGEMKIRFDVAGRERELRVGGDDFLRDFALLENSLRLFLVLPEIRL